MHPHDIRKDAQEAVAEQPPAAEPAAEEIAAWQEIEAGRYMPQRIRGSCRGRALG